MSGNGKSLSSPLTGANTAAPNPLGAFEGLLRGKGRERGKESKEREKKRKERGERDGRKHPPQ